MSLPKWSKKDLEWAHSEGYKIFIAKDEDEANYVKHELKINRRCAQTGFYEKDGKQIPFVVTKERK